MEALLRQGPVRGKTRGSMQAVSPVRTVHDQRSPGPGSPRRVRRVFYVEILVGAECGPRRQLQRERDERARRLVAAARPRAVSSTPMRLHRGGEASLSSAARLERRARLLPSECWTSRRATATSRSQRDLEAITMLIWLWRRSRRLRGSISPRRCSALSMFADCPPRATIARCGIEPQLPAERSREGGACACVLFIAWLRRLQ